MPAEFKLEPALYGICFGTGVGVAAAEESTCTVARQLARALSISCECD